MTEKTYFTNDAKALRVAKNWGDSTIIVPTDSGVIRAATFDEDGELSEMMEADEFTIEGIPANKITVVDEQIEVEDRKIEL